MKKYFVVICVALLLAGCGNSSGADAAADMVRRTEGESVFYAAQVWDTGITPEHWPVSRSFALAEDMLYFAEWSEEGTWSVGGLALSGENRPVTLFQTAGDSVEALTVTQEPEEVPILALAGRGREGMSFLAAYNVEGELLWRQTYECKRETLLSLARDGEGHFYALSRDQALLFDEEGVYQGSIPCPGEGYLDMCAAGEGDVYATYRDGPADEPVLVRLQYQGKKLEGAVRIWGDGQLGARREGSLLMREGSSLFSYAPQRQESAKLLELTDYDLTGNNLQFMEENSDGELLLLSWETARYDRPVELARLREAPGEQQTDGKQTITWLHVGPILPGVDDLVAAFNRQSQEYRVVTESVSLKGVTVTENTTGFDLDTEIFMCVNTRLLASESADILSFVSYQDMERYLSKGYLEDLAPYIARSENIDREDYLEGPLEYYARGEALYGIPATFNIDALMGRESELGAEPGWTVEEFLDWLQEHPDAVIQEGMTKENVLDFCLKGTLEEYVQLDLGQCDFEGESFRELLQRVQSLTTDSAAHWDDWGKMLEEKRPILEQGLAYGFSACNAWENMYGEPLVYKGYPSSDGSPCYFYTGGGMGILSRSACKEGAYAFWEYYLLNEESDSTDLYYTNRELFVKGMEQLADEQYAYTADGKMQFRRLSESGSAEEDGLEWLTDLTEEQRDKQLAMMEHVRIDTLENQTIRNIVIEEASIYFAGVKDLEETCRVIQSRVSMYLAETR